MRKLSDKNKKILLTQIHRDIDQASGEAAKNLSNGECTDIVYPATDVSFSEQEREAVKKLKDIPNIEGALKKVIKNSHSIPFFNFFNFIDGTGDPTGDSWTGAQNKVQNKGSSLDI